MEARVEYLGRVERPRLTVVRDDGSDGRFSALPHAVMRRADLAPAVRLLYAIMQGYAWQGGECRASHETMAAELGCSTRMLRTYLTKLIDAGLVTEHDAGVRRQKVYRLVSIGTVLPIETVNEKPASDSTEVNRKFPTGQSEISDRFNRKPASDLKKKTPVKKTLEEDLPPTGVGAADAADPPAEGAARAKAAKGTRCPATFPLEARHYAYAADHGYTDVAKVAAITDAFLTHHRFKGTVGKDWYAGWQNWIRRQREIDDERASRQPAPPQQQRNGSARMFPGEASKQASKWSESKFRVKTLGGPTDER
jgi:hypothetical protein